MSKAVIQAKFGGKKIGSGENREIPTPKALEKFVQNTAKSNTVSMQKEQPIR